MDIYVLAPERTAAMVERFLVRFLPQRERADADYTVRLGGHELAEVIDTSEELAAFCEARPGADARAYWNTRSGGDPRSAHVFFLSDGGLLLGLSVAAEDEAAWDRWVDDLRVFAKARHGYWMSECPPEDSVAEFVASAQSLCRDRRSDDSRRRADFRDP